MRLNTVLGSFSGICGNFANWRNAQYLPHSRTTIFFGGHTTLTSKSNRTEPGQKPTHGTREQLVADIKKIRKNFPDATLTRDFYRKHGRYADIAWAEYFPAFKAFVGAGGGQPDAPASAPKAAPVELTSEDRLKFDLEKVAVKKEGTQKKYAEALNRIKQLEEENELLIGLDQHTP